KGPGFLFFPGLRPGKRMLDGSAVATRYETHGYALCVAFLWFAFSMLSQLQRKVFSICLAR
ncbi:hypothetical protein, partial [Pseudomonas syringae group genomosp. 3]